MPYYYCYNPLNDNSRTLFPDRMYCGIELEYAVKNYVSYTDISDPLDRAAAKYGLDKAAIWKDDESIPCFEGYSKTGELVTMPFEKEEVYDIFYDFFNIESMRNVKVNWECGYHIHVSKSVLSNEQIFFLRWLCSYKNDFFSDSFKPLLEHVADRQMYRYCTFVEDPYCLHSGVDGYNRREAISVSCRHDTLEFRSFKAPRSLYNFLVAFEFVHALIDLSEQVQEILDKEFLNRIYNQDGLVTSYDVTVLSREYSKLNSYVSFDKVLKHLQSEKYSVLKFNLQEYSAS